ncbi:MAG TPA: site-2 protease family protein [Polyangia bacterium]|nr:site-2 protease family protein [Polyangia bacterium]
MKSARPSALLGIAALAVIAVGMVALGGAGGPLGTGSAQLLILLVMLLLIIPAHELGHAVVGAAVGYHIRAIVVGVGPRLLQLQAAGVTVQVNLLPFGGVTTGFAARSSWPRLRMWLFAAGGPAANLLICWLLKRQAGHGAILAPGQHSVAAMAAAASWSVLIVNLIPFRTGEGQPSDGYALFSVPFWSREQVLRMRVVGGAAPILLALQAGDLAAAESALAELRARHGEHPVVQAFTGLVLHRANRHDEARAAWRAALAGETDSFGRLLLKNNIAWVDVLLDDPASAAEADAYSSEALAGRSELAAFAGTRGAVLDWIGRSAEAVPLLERAAATQTDPRGQATNHACLALALAHLGRPAEAATHRAAARQLDPACEMLARAEAAAATAADEGAPAVSVTAPALSLWQRWGGLARWRQVARGAAMVTLLVPDRPFDFPLLAALAAVLLDPEPAGLLAMGAMQLWVGLFWAVERATAGAPDASLLTIAWFLSSGILAIAMAGARDRLGPRTPTRTAAVLGWALAIPALFRLAIGLRLGSRAFGGATLMGLAERVAGTPETAALLVGLAAVLATRRWPVLRWLAVACGAVALTSVPHALHQATARGAVADIPSEGPALVWAEPRPARVVAEAVLSGYCEDAVLSPGARFVVAGELEEDEPARLRAGPFGGTLRDLRAYAILFVGEDRLAVLRPGASAGQDPELAMMALPDLEHPAWVRSLTGFRAGGATLQPDGDAILILGGSLGLDRPVAYRVPATETGELQVLPAFPSVPRARQRRWFMGAGGTLGEVANAPVGAPPTEANPLGGDQGQAIWLVEGGRTLPLARGLPNLLFPQMLGRPELWAFSQSGPARTLLKVDPVRRTVRRVPGSVPGFSLPVMLGPGRLAFADHDRLGVIDLDARRGTWLTIDRHAMELAQGGLVGISYDESSKTRLTVYAAP